MFHTKKWIAASIAALITCNACSAQSTRTSDLTAAKQILQKGKVKAVAVYLHGSDWCISGEKIKTKIWDQPAFAASLPDDLILCAVNHREASLAKQGAAMKHELAKIQPIPLQSTTPQSDHKALYSKRKDGAWLVGKSSANPATDRLQMHVKLTGSPKLLRLTAMTDPSLPSKGPGRAKNGNFVITEIEIKHQGQPILFHTAASYESKSLIAAAASDGNKQNTNGWSIDAKHINHELYIIPDQALPQDATLEISILSQHKSKQHTLGCFKWDAFKQLPKSAPSAQDCYQYALDHRNKAFSVTTNNYPSIICLNEKGHTIGIHKPIKTTQSLEEVSAIIQGILENRKQWEALIESAKDQHGEPKIKNLAKAWLLMRKSDASEAIYKPLTTEILKLDPERKSPWTWRITPDTKLISAEQKKYTEKNDYKGAISYTDSMLADPRLSMLSTAQRQQLLMSKFHLYRAWKDHQDKRFEVLRDIAKLDPNSTLGIGAAGYITMHGKGEANIAHGWRPHHLPEGEGKLDIKTGVANYFYRPGHYRVSFGTSSSKKPVIIKSVSLIANGVEVSSDNHQGTLLRKKDKDTTYLLKVPTGTKPEKLTLRIQYQAPKDHANSISKIGVSPYLPIDGKFGWK